MAHDAHGVHHRHVAGVDHGLAEQPVGLVQFDLADEAVQVLHQDPLPEFALVDGLEGGGAQLGPQHPFRVDEVLPHRAGNDPAVLRAAEDVHDVADDVGHHLDVVDRQIAGAPQPEGAGHVRCADPDAQHQVAELVDQGQVVRQHPDTGLQMGRGGVLDDRHGPQRLGVADPAARPVSSFNSCNAARKARPRPVSFSNLGRTKP